MAYSPVWPSPRKTPDSPGVKPGFRGSQTMPSGYPTSIPASPARSKIADGRNSRDIHGGSARSRAESPKINVFQWLAPVRAPLRPAIAKPSRAL